MPEPKKHETVQEELPLEVKGSGGNAIVEYILKASALINYKGYSMVGKSTIQNILLRNKGLNGLIECGITPKEVADFVNSIEQDPPHSVFPGEHVRAVLSNIFIHGLIATDARLQDEDKFFKEWEFDGRLGFWSRKKQYRT